VPLPAVKPQQRRWLSQLRSRFGNECVVEWRAFVDRQDRYCPHLDLAVGPFSTVPGERKVEEYRLLSGTHRAFLNELWTCHSQNEARLGFQDDQCAADLDEALSANRNARCFLAIEIENVVSRKHLMGGVVNATALGHLGILIGWTADKVRALFRARKYLHFLTRVGKPAIAVGNLLVLGRDQARDVFSIAEPLLNTRLKLAARVNRGQSLSSARRSPSALR